ncbi:carbonate dehydratase [Leeia sp. TBRC 13508]|uniref:Carbonic anhydrase n=1 Tax=Leeia speluncae TaxID=2884804 RepID=A0ABS8D8R5_9NEIS|nr:carbonate dehydratase [Leeia speluncae]MCB6184612.1 carbonate dehydratase [Leeia speluncae]
MSLPLTTLFENNQRWADKVNQRDPGFFEKLSLQQAPEYLWIGCSDSRVPANELIGLLPGEVFVHRNIANLIVHSDLNCLSTIQFAVDVLAVKHIIVCGHYGCGGVNAALQGKRVGLVDNWLRHIHDINQKHEILMSAQPDIITQSDRLCELNVIEQVLNACQTTVVQDAWQRGQPLTVHGWVYRLNNGLLHDLKISISSQEELLDCYNDAVNNLRLGK